MQRRYVIAAAVLASVAAVAIAARATVFDNSDEAPAATTRPPAGLDSEAPKHEVNAPAWVVDVATAKAAELGDARGRVRATCAADRCTVWLTGTFVCDGCEGASDGARGDSLRVVVDRTSRRVVNVSLGR